MSRYVHRLGYGSWRDILNRVSRSNVPPFRTRPGLKARECSCISLAFKYVAHMHDRAIRGFYALIRGTRETCREISDIFDIRRIADCIRGLSYLITSNHSAFLLYVRSGRSAGLNACSVISMPLCYFEIALRNYVTNNLTRYFITRLS
jgi:hypothetical protein